MHELENPVEKLRQSVALHEQQEEHHREQKRIQKEKLVLVEECLASFRTAAEAALEVAEPPAAPAVLPVHDLEDWGSMSRPKVGKMIERVVAERTADSSPFGARDISREVNRRFGDKMRSTTDGRKVSVNLRRLEGRRLGVDRGHWSAGAFYRSADRRS